MAIKDIVEKIGGSLFARVGHDDELRRDLSVYRHAFETTAADRDRLQRQLDRLCGRVPQTDDETTSDTPPPPPAPTLISPPPSVDADDPTLARRIADADCSQFRDMMLSLDVPPDIVDRVVALDFSDQDKIDAARLSCFGRLQYLQPAGLFVASLLQRKIGLSPLPGPELANLNADGAIPIKPLLSSSQAREVRDFLLGRPVYNGHVPEAAADRIGRYVGYGAEQYPFGSSSIADIVAAPHLIEAVLSNEILAMAQAHLGCVPTLSNLQAWWNFSEHRGNRVGSTERSTTDYAPQNYHRDLNDFRMFWVYMYLTDVDDDCGPHEVLKGSGNYRVIAHRFRGADTLNIQDLFYQYGYQIPHTVMDDTFSGATATFRGPAGTTFLSNGFNFHRIRYPLTKRRLMFAARFSIHPPVYRGPARDGDPIPADILTKRVVPSPLLRHVTRNLFDWR